MRLSFKLLAVSTLVGCIATHGNAQQVEPRLWTHLPTGLNVVGGGYAHTDADITFNPVLRIEDATLDLHTAVFRYVRTFEIFNRSARLEFLQAWQDGTWSGLLDGAQASVNRTGWSDANVRLAISLYGAPPLSGKEYASYRAGQKVETTAGAALSIQLPTGQYKGDKLLNLGTNRFTFRPQIGVVHQRGNWSFESTASVWFYTENDSFFQGTKLEQDPLYTIQGSATYTFRPGLWVSVGAAYGYGGESTIDGVEKDDRKENLVWSISAGYPLSRKVSLKTAYIGSQSNTSLGADTNTFSLGFSTSW